jgi:phenylacetate-CoA ligase
VSHDETTTDVMVLHAEVPSGTDPALAARVAESLQAVTKLKGSVVLTEPGRLPNDGKVIEDTRKLT